MKRWVKKYRVQRLDRHSYEIHDTQNLHLIQYTTKYNYTGCKHKISLQMVKKVKHYLYHKFEEVINSDTFIVSNKKINITFLR